MEQVQTQHEEVRAPKDVVSLGKVETVVDDDLMEHMAMLHWLKLRSDCWHEDKESYLRVGYLEPQWGGLSERQCLSHHDWIAWFYLAPL